MQNYKKISDFIEKFKNFSIVNDCSKKLFAKCLINKIMRSDSISERRELLLLGYEKQLPGFRFENKIELINCKWYFNNKKVADLSNKEKQLFQLELINLYIQSI